MENFIATESEFIDLNEVCGLSMGCIYFKGGACVCVSPECFETVLEARSEMALIKLLEKKIEETS